MEHLSLARLMVGITGAVLVAPAVAAPVRDTVEVSAAKRICTNGVPAPDFAKRSIQWRTKAGIDCTGAALQRLSGTDLPTDALLDTDGLLWSLATFANAHKDAASPTAVLKTTWIDLKHPLRAQAGLALAWIAQDRTPYLADTATVLAIGQDINRARLDHDWFAALPPTHRRALVWWVASEAAATMPKPNGDVAQRFADAAKFADALSDLANLPDVFADAVIRDAMTKPILLVDLPAAGAPAPAPNGALLDMTFHVGGQVCAAGLACDPLNATVTGSGKDSKGWEHSWGDGGTSSLAGMGYSVQSLSAGFLRNYVVAAASGARGGNEKLNPWTHHGLSSQDHTSNVIFTIEGSTKIVQCTDASVCATTLAITVAQGPDGIGEAIAHISAPGREQDLIAGQTTYLDRTHGDSVLTIKMQHAVSHSQACCEAPAVNEWISVEVVEPVRISDAGGWLMPSAQLNNFNLYATAANTLAARGAPGTAGPFLPGTGPILLGSTIRSAAGSPSYDTRFRTVLLRLLLARVVRDALWSDLNTVERASLDAATQATSDLARSYKTLVAADVARDQQIVLSLAFPELNKAIGDIETASNIATEVDPAHVSLAQAMAMKTLGDNKSDELDDAARFLSAARDKDQNVDALLLLLKARDSIDARRDAYVDEIAALTLELAQYQ